MFSLIALVCFILAAVLAVAGWSLGSFGAIFFIALGLVFFVLSHGVNFGMFNRSNP